MKEYTYSEARQNLSTLLDEVETYGEIRIQRRDGRTFIVRPAPLSTSPSMSPPFRPTSPKKRSSLRFGRSGSGGKRTHAFQRRVAKNWAGVSTGIGEFLKSLILRVRMRSAPLCIAVSALKGSLSIKTSKITSLSTNTLVTEIFLLQILITDLVVIEFLSVFELDDP